MPLETKFLRLRAPVTLGSRFGDWQVCWLGGWSRDYLHYLVMVVFGAKPPPSCPSPSSCLALASGPVSCLCCVMPKAPKVVSIQKDTPKSKLIARDTQVQRVIIGIGNQRIAYDFHTRITHLRCDCVFLTRSESPSLKLGSGWDAKRSARFVNSRNHSQRVVFGFPSCTICEPSDLSSLEYKRRMQNRPVNAA
jgi:hypothetical protein